MKNWKIASRSVSSSMLILGAVMLCSFTDAHAACRKVALSPAMETVAGNAFLCTTKAGVTAEIRASGLTAGDAYTFWFVYIDNAAKCAADGMVVCVGINLPDDVPDAAFGRVADVIAPAKGKVTIVGTVPGLQLSAGSQVMFLLKGHGPANPTDNLARARQILTAEDATVGSPGLGIVGGAVADFAATAAFNN
jgi:hypothetical protein